MRMLLLLLITPTFAFSQGLVQPTYLVRAETATFDPHYGWTHFCVLVYPDGKYHLEREKVDTDNKKKSKVYLGQLPDSSIRELRAATDDPDFQVITTPWKHGGLLRDPDVIRAWVPREQQLQYISFETSKQRHPYEKILKPLVNWMKEVEKQKGSALESETANDCAAPLVFYRHSVPDPSQAESKTPEKK